MKSNKSIEKKKIKKKKSPDNNREINDIANKSLIGTETQNGLVFQLPLPY